MNTTVYQITEHNNHQQYIRHDLQNGVIVNKNGKQYNLLLRDGQYMVYNDNGTPKPLLLKAYQSKNTLPVTITDEIVNPEIMIDAYPTDGESLSISIHNNNEIVHSKTMWYDPVILGHVYHVVLLNGLYNNLSIDVSPFNGSASATVVADLIDHTPTKKI